MQKTRAGGEAAKSFGPRSCDHIGRMVEPISGCCNQKLDHYCVHKMRFLWRRRRRLDTNRSDRYDWSVSYRTGQEADRKGCLMTLEAYDAEQLDRLALRVFDIAAILRGMAETQRRESLERSLLHDKKALEWIDRLERWARRAEAEMQVDVLRAQAAADARRATSYSRGSKRAGSRKKKS